MKIINLSQGYTALVDDEDYDLASRYKWSVDKRPKTNYAKGWDNERRKIIYLHRIIAGAQGRHVLVDHKDRNGLNNTRENLTLSTHSKNQFNRGKNSRNTTGFKGVTKRKDSGRYQAQMILNRRGVHLGVYDTPELASQAYDKAVAELTK